MSKNDIRNPGFTRYGLAFLDRLFIIATSNKQQATSNKQQATSNKQQATSNKQQATYWNLLFASCFSLCLVLTDFILEAFLPSYNVKFDPVFLAMLFGMGFLVSFNKNKAFFYLFIGFLFFLQFAQVGSIVYFGYCISPENIYKIFSETSDIASVAFAEAGSLLLVPLAVCAPFLILLSVFWVTRKNTRKIPFIFLLVLLMFVPKIERATRRDIQFFFPSPVRYSFHNTLNAFSFYAGREMWLNEHFQLPQDFYAPYATRKQIPLVDNLVFVIGESVNPHHLSLFGYERKTTPFLDSLVSDASFNASVAIAGGVATHSSLAFLLNGVREPGNIPEMKAKTFNIFRLAKEQGFTTVFISAQDAKVAYEIGNQYIDTIITREEHPALFKIKRDMALLDILRGIKLGERNLVVVNLRAPHAPYAENYDESSEFDIFGGSDKRVDTYDNAILYFDKVMENLFFHFKSIGKPGHKNAFLFTSDHGQAFGEKGFFGHNKLDISVAEVPFIQYGVNARAESPPPFSHYEITRWIGELLGYEMMNPNQKDDSFFIHGNNFLSDYEFIPYSKKNSGVRTREKMTLKAYMKQRQQADTPSFQ
jgi:glucan phosphoethanolaminetransferase (alkaline phosphatase superfamily)